MISPERRTEIARKAGKRRAELGVGYKFSSEKAKEAGRKGGIARGVNALLALGGDPSEFDSPEQMRFAAQRFTEQRARAKDRALGFELTFSQWWSLWKESGHWNDRGRSRADSYVMARRGDIGPYAIGNVYITTLSQNFIESWQTAPDRMTGRKQATQIFPA